MVASFLAPALRGQHLVYGRIRPGFKCSRQPVCHGSFHKRLMLCRIPVVTVTEQWMPFAVLKGPGFPALCDHFTEKLCERLYIDSLRDLCGEACICPGQVSDDFCCRVDREISPAPAKSRHQDLFLCLTDSGLVGEPLRGGHRDHSPRC